MRLKMSIGMTRRMANTTTNELKKTFILSIQTTNNRRKQNNTLENLRRLIIEFIRRGQLVKDRIDLRPEAYKQRT